MVEWNLVLDENYGPHVPDACTICRGIVTLNALTSYALNCEYYGMGHFSKFLKDGARKLRSIVFGGSSCVSGTLPSPNTHTHVPPPPPQTLDKIIFPLIPFFCSQGLPFVTKIIRSWRLYITGVGLRRMWLFNYPIATWNPSFRLVYQLCIGYADKIKDFGYQKIC